MAWLKHRVGMHTVFCFDMDPARLATAERFGALPMLVSGGEDERHHRAQTVREHCPRGVDVVVEMTGARQVVTEGVSLLRHGGHYAFAGMVHPDTQLTALTGETIIRKCLTIRGVHNYTPWNLEEAIRFMEEFQDDLPFESVLSPTDYSLRDINKAFDEAFHGQHCRVPLNLKSC